MKPYLLSLQSLSKWISHKKVMHRDLNNFVQFDSFTYQWFMYILWERVTCCWTSVEWSFPLRLCKVVFQAEYDFAFNLNFISFPPQEVLIFKPLLCCCDASWSARFGHEIHPTINICLCLKLHRACLRAARMLFWRTCASKASVFLPSTAQPETTSSVACRSPS